MTIPHTPSLLKTLFGLLDSQRPAFGQERAQWRGVGLLLAEVLAGGPHRVTDLLRTLGCHRLEWSAWQRLFEQPGRFEEEGAATHLLVESLQHVPASAWQLPLALERLLAWLWQRWELEVTHRESKSLLGLGDKQCWNSGAAVSSVQWSAWVQGLLMLTGYRVYGLPTPPQSAAAWYRHPKRWTLTRVVQACRTERWEQPDFLPLFAPSADNWQKIEAFLQRRPWSTPAPP